MSVTMSEEQFVQLDQLAETFADLVFSVEVTKDHVYIALGVNRLDHRPKIPVKQSVPAARLVLPHRTAKELATLMQGAVQAMAKVKNDNDRAALKLEGRPVN
jgi:hypothetical protein